MALSERQELEWVCTHFDELLACPTLEARKQYLLEHPILFSGAALGLIQQARAGDERAAGAIAFLDQSRQRFWEQPDDYPLGLGPLELLAAELREGAVDLDEALARAREPECANLLSHTYVRAVMLSWTKELQNDVTYALQLAEIALESALACSLPRLAADVRRASAEGFIRLAHGGLMRRPDGRIYERAQSIGAWALDDARHRGKGPLIGQYLHDLGTLSLDAYGANFGPTPDYADQVEAWLLNAADAMPPASEGLESACKYLSDAIAFREEGRELGQTLKALTEATVYRASASRRAADPAEVASLAAKALRFLDPVADADAVSRVALLRDNFGQARRDPPAAVAGRGAGRPPRGKNTKGRRRS